MKANLVKKNVCDLLKILISCEVNSLKNIYIYINETKILLLLLLLLLIIIIIIIIIIIRRRRIIIRRIIRRIRIKSILESAKNAAVD